MQNDAIVITGTAADRQIKIPLEVQFAVEVIWILNGWLTQFGLKGKASEPGKLAGFAPKISPSQYTKPKKVEGEVYVVTLTYRTESSAVVKYRKTKSAETPIELDEVVFRYHSLHFGCKAEALLDGWVAQALYTCKQAEALTVKDLVLEPVLAGIHRMDA